jgi:Zn-dependent protease/predicted transcriptional regulator
VLGIPIRVHSTFLLLVVWYGYHSSRVGHDLALALIFLALLFGCVVLHELGHAAMAGRFGVSTREIVLYPIGGIARLENIPGGKTELLIAVAGPAVNLVLALAVGVVMVATDAARGLPAELTRPSDLLNYLLVVNLALLLFNLVPAFPMDGGRILRAGLTMAVSDRRATEIASAVGQAMAILFAIGGIVGGNPFLLIIALFVFVGASQEASYFRRREAIAGKTARHAMMTRFETLAPHDSLEVAAQHLRAANQGDFPVIDAWGRVVGVLSRSGLMEGMAHRDEPLAVLDVMERELSVVSPDDDLDRVLGLLRSRPSCPVLVIDEGGLRGMITLSSLAEFIELSRRLSARRARA